MACTPLPPFPAPPALPDGISLDPSLTIPTPDAELCCKVFSMPAIPVLVPFPPGTFNPALAATINTFMSAVLANVRGRAIPCPKE